jgi:competence protein ComFB
VTVHNYAEEEVLAKVAQIFEAEEAASGTRACTCEKCRLDVACFVLNRFPPTYQTSGRGLAHRESDYGEKLQRDADLTALVRRGMERIAETRRPHCPEDGEGQAAESQEGAFFNFPQIVGRLIHSTSFEPIAGVTVRLLSESGQEMRMTDSHWSNPFVIPDRVPGVFSFWPVPEKATAAGEEKAREMKVCVDDPAFESLRHYFTVKAVSEDGWLRFSSGSRLLTLPDLFLVPV